MRTEICIYILIMAVITYLIRMLPLVVFRKEIKSRFIKSFLYYVPYVTLSVMTFPAILTATGDIRTGLAGFVIALLLSWRGFSLPAVAAAACAAVLITSFIL